MKNYRFNYILKKKLETLETMRQIQLRYPKFDMSHEETTPIYSTTLRIVIRKLCENEVETG